MIDNIYSRHPLREPGRLLQEKEIALMGKTETGAQELLSGAASGDIETFQVPFCWHSKKLNNSVYHLSGRAPVLDSNYSWITTEYGAIIGISMASRGRC